MRIAIATDAWFPQINGVVRKLSATVTELDRRGYEVELITPERFFQVPMPGYPSIGLAVAPRFSVRRMLDRYQPDVVHITTEGPIGWSARNWCKARNVPFTTAFHTRFADYAAVRSGLSAERFWPLLKKFHGESQGVLAATPSLQVELDARGIGPSLPWGSGVDRWLFNPIGDSHPDIALLPGPVLLYVGRVAPEKNLDAFLSLDNHGTKVVVGDGPSLEFLKRSYPEVVFTGAKSGEELASAYRAADCFVFPSRTDTFGLVLIEALACGLPIAAFPVSGPLDVVGVNGRGPDSTLPATIGALDEDLSVAISKALRLDRLAAAVYGASFSWEAATDQFVTALENAVTAKDKDKDKTLQPA